ncbi:MAG: DDE-type integrase/transposase/recombinase, partial [Thermoplasmata archaeon]|nr:DDE-type integrase/transposase/recombinase [Thermoplasmata archaeon]
NTWSECKKDTANNKDRGPQFYSNRGSKSQFQEYLEMQKIKHVVSRKNNPQTNGKVERFWLEYAHHRWRFSSIHEFLEWYNHRIHGSS